jgi:hypothetical protein
VAFFQFVDICARSERVSIHQIGRLFNLAATGCTRIGTKGLADLLSSPAATALGSALCSLFKLAAQHMKEQAVEAAAATAAGDAWEDNGLSRLLLSSPTLLFSGLLAPLGNALLPAMHAAMAAPPSSSSSSGSSSGKQARASAMFLAVLVLRGFVQVHEAAASVPAAAAAGLAQDATDAPIVSDLEARVQRMMVCMLAVFRLAAVVTADTMKCRRQFGQLQAHLKVSEVSSSAAAAAVAETSEAAPVPPEPHSNSSSSQPVRWQHLLSLHLSLKLVAASMSFGNAWSKEDFNVVLCRNQVPPGALSQGQSVAEVYAAAVSKEQLAEMRQLYQDALQFCRTITALAPLPVVCNNPRCGELSGVSEAAAARYVCAGCGCRYCSAACQAAGWRSHKKACRRMAAYGLRVEGG